MKNFTGEVLFSENGSFSTADIIGKKFIIAKNLHEDFEESIKDLPIIGVIFSTLPQKEKLSLANKNIFVIDMDKKNIEDMFHTFESKDTNCSIIKKDDGTMKVKLISGSLSKSYEFMLNELCQKLIED